MKLSGRIFVGIGDQTRRQDLHPNLYLRACGYMPHLGSLNVKLGRPVDLADLGPPSSTITVEGDRSFLWRVRVAGVDAPAHLMVFRTVPTVQLVELLSPVRLRDHLKRRVAFEVLPS